MSRLNAAGHEERVALIQAVVASTGPAQSPSRDVVIHGCRVLVAEDEFLIADDLAHALACEGAEVVGPAATVEQGIDAVRTRPVDAAILDINLGGALA